MPATEQTWRNQKWMHIIFGVSSLLMLLFTVWMLVQDHDREWKQYQEEFYSKLETWDLHTQILAQEKDRAYQFGEETRQELLAQFRSEVPDRFLIDLFNAEVKYDAARRAAGDAQDLLANVINSRAASTAALTAARRETDENAQQIVDAALEIEKLQREIEGATAPALDSLNAQLDQQKERREAKEAERQAAIDRLEAAAGPFVQAAAELESAEADAFAQDIAAAYESFAADPAADGAREKLIEAFSAARERAMFREKALQQQLKFKRAEFDGENSLLSIAIGNGDPASDIERLRAKVEQLRSEVQAVNLLYEAANRHRLVLDDVQGIVEGEVSAAQKSIDAFQLALNRLEKTYSETTGAFDRLGRDVVTLPVLDAFNNSEIKIKHIWLPDLTQNYNHKQVARFDRCVTCHLGIDKTAPGTATEPAYEPERVISQVALATPAAAPASPDADLEKNDRLLELYGLSLSPEGLFNPDDALIDNVRPGSAAANALLQRGDVIEKVYVDGVPVRLTSVDQAFGYLLDSVTWGQPIVMDIRRGVPQPYSAHPRLDLYGTDSSPHSFKKFGCTICHEGQGNATTFKWSSHSPNDLNELKAWSREHEWFDNHHWIYPMYPERFQESSCLRCHHTVVELNPSERFPEPPAPKLMAGYDAVRMYGCFGCHEINGFAGVGKTIGPDLRLEPNYVPAAQQLFVDPQLADTEQAQRREQVFTQDAPDDYRATIQALAATLIHNPDDTAARHKLEQLVKEDARRADPSSTEPAYLSGEMYGLGSVLADQETPGTMRKVGPSLRHVGAKLDESFMYDWIMQPSDFRPSTRMPQFFGQYGHFLPEHDEDSAAPTEPQNTQQLEQVEALALTRYLQKISQPFAYGAEQLPGTLPASADRGKLAFQTKGCLACHAHQSFPEAQQDQGPDLSNLGAKLSGEAGSKGLRWLTSWLRQPDRYHARTKMPNVFLQAERYLGPTGAPLDENGQPIPQGGTVDVTAAPLIDPAADIAAFLLQKQGPDSGTAGQWQPAHAVPDVEAAGFQDALRELTLEYLGGSFTRSQAERFINEGIPAELAPELKGDERELIGDFANDPASRQDHLLQYIGRKSVGKYGCYACHDISGFEGSKPIGTALADWGRKDPSKLAFEQVGQLVHHTDLTEGVEPTVNPATHAGLFVAPHDHEPASGDHEAIELIDLPDADKAYFLNSLMGHQRTGFLWQKLREPRSYDYEKTELKGYNERLKMPLFPFDAEQREQVMTFVLGLVSDAPADKFVYAPDERQQAINAGNLVLEKYNCAGCHQLEIDRWTFNFDPADYAGDVPFPADAYDVFRQFHTQAEVAQSRVLDNRGLGTATVTGRKATDDNGQVAAIENETEVNGETVMLPSTQFVTLWQPALINGQSYLAFDQVPVREDRFVNHIPGRGGFLADYLHDVALAQVKSVRTANYQEAWAWVPPPLFNEGVKVQTEWLYNFLLEPIPIRPSVVLRMPKFNMSRDEARILANYFAARDNAGYPYEVETRSGFQASESQANITSQALAPDDATMQKFEDAMRIVTNGNYCIKCHKIGDYSPGGDVTALAPNLERVYKRLRPGFLHKWLADPRRMLPYTGMPVNFPLDKPVRPELFSIETGDLIHSGSSPEELEAVVDLLLNYDWYMRREHSIVPLINQPPVAGGASDGASPPPNND